MASTFDAKTRELGRMVGDGKLVGKVTVDQVYALAIHSGYWRSGPLAGVTNRPRHGGQSHFLAEPLQTNRERYVRNLARRALVPSGLVNAMAENMNHLAGQVYRKAPREKDVLRNSARVQVFDGGALAINREPIVARLSAEELRHRERFVPEHLRRRRRRA